MPTNSETFDHALVWLSRKSKDGRPSASVPELISSYKEEFPEEYSSAVHDDAALIALNHEFESHLVEADEDDASELDDGYTGPRSTGLLPELNQAPQIQQAAPASKKSKPKVPYVNYGNQPWPYKTALRIFGLKGP